MRTWIVVLAAAFLLQLSPAGVRAQGSGPDFVGSDTSLEIGFHLGKLLPNLVPGATEILSLGGVRGGFRIGPMGFAEFGLTTGNSLGVAWQNFFASLRLDVPVEQLVGFVYLGADAVRYGPQGGDLSLLGSGHVGGGVQALLADAVWFRGDMKFNVNPGTALYIGFGFVFRL